MDEDKVMHELFFDTLRARNADTVNLLLETGAVTERMKSEALSVILGLEHKEPSDQTLPILNALLAAGAKDKQILHTCLSVRRPLEYIKCLVAWGADVNAIGDNSNKIPLDYTQYNSIIHEGQTLYILRVLLDAGSDLLIRTTGSWMDDSYVRRWHQEEARLMVRNALKTQSLLKLCITHIFERPLLWKTRKLTILPDDLLELLQRYLRIHTNLSPDHKILRRHISRILKKKHSLTIDGQTS